MDKARLSDTEKQVIDARKSNILQAERLYKERQVMALGLNKQGQVYQRAQAFDGRSAEAALARYPELDGAYKQLAGREGADRTALQAKLSEQLHRGELPQGAVTRDESRQVLAMAAAHRGLIVRDGDSFDREIKASCAGQGLGPGGAGVRAGQAGPLGRGWRAGEHRAGAAAAPGDGPGAGYGPGARARPGARAVA